MTLLIFFKTIFLFLALIMTIWSLMKIAIFFVGKSTIYPGYESLSISFLWGIFYLLTQL